MEGRAQDSGAKVDFELFTDIRVGFANGEQSWLDRGLGKSRFGGNENGGFQPDLDIAQIALLTNVELNWEWSAFIHAKYDDAQGGPIDLVEAYVQYNPTPASSTRYGFKPGCFFHIFRVKMWAWRGPAPIH